MKMADKCDGTHQSTGAASTWIVRWTHLLPAASTVLDVACGAGRHMAWFANRGHAVTGIDRDLTAARNARCPGELVQADIESDAWPLMAGDQPRQFGAVVVTNYLWRPLLPTIVQSVAPAGVLIYETFTSGHETVGRPHRPDFLLQNGELWTACQGMRVVAYENGFLEEPERFVQRIVAVRPDLPFGGPAIPARYLL